MQGAIRAEGPVGTANWVLETGKLAKLADGAVVVTLGDTQVLCTAVASRSAREGQDFFPLTVDVEERMYAVGKIPGSFFRREGRPTEQAILTCRLTDRPLRPSFPKGFRNEVQVISTILAADQENPHDVVSINGASAALMLSGMPFDGPIGAVRMGLRDGEWHTNPTFEESAAGVFDLIVAGRRNEAGEIDIMMVEAGATVGVWEHVEGGQAAPTEERVAAGLEAAKEGISQLIDLQLRLKEQVHVEPLAYKVLADYTEEMSARVEAIATDGLREIIATADKQERQTAEDALRTFVLEQLAEEFPGEEKAVKEALRALQKKMIRRRILDEGLRIDGRSTTDIRPLNAEAGFVPGVHGSGLFERGETQVLNVATLGMLRLAQTLDTIGVDDSKRYMHNYNFPPFSVGETGRVGTPKRREVGHGALAERALLPMIPDEEEFPYALRLVSEVLSSNGSTSMASVCASTLSLMDAGVPIKAPVAGIAMGLVAENGRFQTLTDILGAEDAFGDMDFKVAGTGEFITALQLDTKIKGLPAEVLAGALAQAKEARLAILEVIREALPAPREEVAPTAPRITSIKVPIDKIGEVIGPKGKVIKDIQAETGAQIDVEDDGTIRVGATDADAVRQALEWIEAIANPPQPEIDTEYTGKVVSITKFGAFVNILPGRDGLVHISKLGGGRRLDRVEDVLDIGDEMVVRVEEIDSQGRVNLTPVSGPEGSVGPASAGGAPPEGRRREGGGREGGGREGGGREGGGRREEGRPRAGGAPRPAGARREGGGRERDRGDRGGRSDQGGDRRDQGGGDGGQQREVVSFEDEFERQND